MRHDFRSILGFDLAGACLLAVLFSGGCGGGGGGEASPPAVADPAGGGNVHELGAHGGEVLALGNGEVHVELVHEDHEGRIDLYLSGADAETALEVADAPAVNLRTAAGPQQLTARPVGGSVPASHFEVTGPVLAADHLDGQLVIRALGKQYFAALPSHDHEGGAAHTHAENAISFTTWTESCEWFVELEAPAAGKPAAFAAHVTSLESFQPVTAGSFRVEASGGGRTASTQAAAPARPGIFTPSITMPTAGHWTMRLTYEHQGFTDTIEWLVTVHEPGQVPAPVDDPVGVISFLKEQQWKIPFATAKVEAGPTLLVPESAVLEDAGEQVIFVQLGGESFERRIVEVGPAEDGELEIRSGARAGERVVTKGAASIVSSATGS